MARVLLIEDDDLLRDVLAQSLAAGGHDVVQASNGEEGVTLFRAAPADIVVTDIVMPVQEGVETIMQLRKHRRDLPIIAMSGGVPHSKLYLGIAGKIGAHKILAKPFTPAQLQEAINEALAAVPPS
jgi:CheY-like chemotaxis protein